MPYSDTAKALMLDALDESLAAGADFLSLHTAYSTTGANEVTGGSPAYARKGCVWNAAGSGAKALNANVVFDVPASTTVAWIGLWDAVTAGTFLGMFPNGSAAAKVFNTLEAQAADTIRSPGHGLVANDGVVFFGTLPTGLTAGTIYYVKATGLTTDTFTVSAAAGDGAAINITGASGFGILQKIVPETFAAQGTFTVQAASSSLDLTLV